MKYLIIWFYCTCFSINANSQSRERSLQIQEVAEKQVLSEKLNEQFTFHANFKSTILDSNHKPIKQLTEQELDVVPDHGGYIMKRISINGKPLTDEHTSKENDQVNSNIQNRESKKDTSRRIPLISDLIRLCQVTQAAPKPDAPTSIVIFKFKPRSGAISVNSNTRLIVASEGDIYVDTVSAQIIKFQGKVVRAMQSEPRNPPSLPIGSTYKFENTMLNDGVWVPQRDTICTPQGSIFNRQFIERITEFSDYRKFEISGERIERISQ